MRTRTPRGSDTRNRKRELPAWVAKEREETMTLVPESERSPRIVAFGGGTGMSCLLRGLRRHSTSITAIVTVTDKEASSLIHRLDIEGLIDPPAISRLEERSPLPFPDPVEVALAYRIEPRMKIIENLRA